MAKNRNRAQIVAADGKSLRFIPVDEAFALLASGDYSRLTSSKDFDRGKMLVIRMKERRTADRVRSTGRRSQTSLTHGDMIASAEGREERRVNRAVIRVDRWPATHDRYAVTVHAGKVWIPNQKAVEAEKRKIAGARS